MWHRKIQPASLPGKAAIMLLPLQWIYRRPAQAFIYQISREAEMYSREKNGQANGLNCSLSVLIQTNMLHWLQTC